MTSIELLPIWSWLATTQTPTIGTLKECFRPQGIILFSLYSFVWEFHSHHLQEVNKIKKIITIANASTRVLVLAGALTATSVADAQDVRALPTFSQVLSAMDQNAVKVSNFQVRSIMVTVTSPQFWGEPDEKLNPATLIKGKEVKIQRNLGVADIGKIFLDQLTTRLTPIQNLQEHMKYWLDEEKGINTSLMQQWDYLTNQGRVDQLNAGVPTAHPNAGQGIPFPDLGHLQIRRNSTSKRTTYLTAYDANITGLQEFRGLSCLRLNWEKPAMGGYNLKGFVLVCPSRDYKELYKENEAVSVSPGNTVKRFTQVTTVNELKKYGDSWIPTDVSYERQDFYENNEVRSLQQRFRVVDFQIDPDTTLFSPLFSPGTRVFQGTPTGGDSSLSVAGGDIFDLAATLRTGDFSPLKADTKDLAP